MFFSGKKLTPEMERNLALCIASESDLHDLGVHGFKLGERIIWAALHNQRALIGAAASEVIKQWVREQEDKEKAYEELVTILRKIGRNAWINELEY